MQIIGLGLNNILVIAMPDGVLTADKARSEDTPNQFAAN